MVQEVGGQIAAVIFDMDGVIFDSERLFVELWKPIARENGIPDIEETVYRCIGVTTEVTRRIFAERYGEDFPMEAYQKVIRKGFQDVVERGELPVKEGVFSVLEYLKGRGYPTAIASSTTTQTVKKELSIAGLLDFFTVIVGGDMVEKSKPAPDIFLRAAHELVVAPSHCLVIEDSYNGIRAAKAAGMTAIMVPDLLQPDEEMRSLADAIVPTLGEITDFF